VEAIHLASCEAAALLGGQADEDLTKKDAGGVKPDLAIILLHLTFVCGSPLLAAAILAAQLAFLSQQLTSILQCSQ